MPVPSCTATMHWKVNYFAKHAAQKALGAVPRGFVVQEFAKRAIHRWDRPASEQYIRSTVEAKISRLNAAGIRPPRVIVEQGTGWLGIDLILFHLAGADRIATYDTRPWLRSHLLRRNAEVLAGSTNIVKRWNGTDPAGVDERAERLNERLDFPWPALLEHLGVSVRVTRSMDRSELEPGSVDLFYSDSVLQFVAPDDLSALILQAQRFLQPSGLSFHVIECLDLHARIDRRVPPLGYLAYSDRVWRLMTSRYLNYQNRLRMPEFVELFRRAGIASQILNPVIRSEDVEYARSRLARVARFDRMSAEEIAIRRFWLKSHAP